MITQFINSKAGKVNQCIEYWTAKIHWLILNYPNNLDNYHKQKMFLTITAKLEKTHLFNFLSTFLHDNQGSGYMIDGGYQIDGNPSIWSLFKLQLHFTQPSGAQIQI